MMLNKVIRLLILVLLTIPALTACGLLQEPTTPSAPIAAIPLEPETAEEGALAPSATENATGVIEDTATAADEAYPAEETNTAAEPYPAVEPAIVQEPVQEAYPTEGSEGAATIDPAAASGTATVYRIDPASSQVRFELNEEFRGVPTLVVGTTDQIAGELSVNLSDLTATQVGVLQINARALLTDNNFRNRAIQNQILETNEFEFITFTPTAVNGLPANAQLGQAVQFSIAGELTIRGVTQPIEFTVEATPMTESQLVGTASTTINRVDFGLNIPSAPGIANVEEEVELYIDFVANAS